MRDPLPRPLTFRYVGALLSIAGVLVAGQLIVQRALDRQEGDARVINTAGRQRMLSQRLCMMMLALRDQPDRAGELRRVVDEWQASEDVLELGRPETGGNSPAIHELFATIEADHRAMLDAARTALASPATSADPARVALGHQDAFLAGMDRIVSEYEREARERVLWLRRIELALLALALTVLALEGLFVFRPAVRALRNYLAGRDRAEQQLVEVSDREQQRLARDLHDGLSQHLVGISFLAESLRDGATEPQLELIDDISELLADAVNQTRVLARGLHSQLLESEGLETALREVAAQTERMFGVACRVEVAPGFREPLAPARDHLYRIAREAIANAAKHAQATAIDVELAHADDHLVLRVRDDGVGIGSPPHQGLGLQMMAYRARMLGATLDVRAGEPRGTVVTCSLHLS